MIIIFGGTTEGRIAAKVCDQAAKSYIYSTKGEEQQLEATYAQRLCGGVDSYAMVELFQREGIGLVVDAAHPYATQLHQNISQAAELCNIPVVRFERHQRDLNYDNIMRFDSISEVINYIETEELCDILALTGVKSAAALSSIATKHKVTLRVMDRESSHAEIHRSKFPESRVVFYDLFHPQRDEELCRNLNIKAILTKDSGLSGGFDEKVEVARELGLPLLIINRPTLPRFTTTIYGEFGLRRAIEHLLPTFFRLRTGFTTGSAATAASVAALRAIIDGNVGESALIYLPNGEPFEIQTSLVWTRKNYAECRVIKDGGDDPDATHNIEIIAKVTLLPEADSSNVTIRGGEGVGRVTLPGVGVDVGEAAINPVPRHMIVENIERVLSQNQIKGAVEIEIEVPEGESIGAKTFNPRLGIVGGISILGTSGIVQPFSSEAFLESIKRQIEIVKALGYDHIVINSGAMSERYVRAYHSQLPPQCYIHYGNLVGATIKLAASEGVKKVTVGCMIGKAVKLAKGALDTHSKSTVIDRDFIQKLAEGVNCSEDTKLQISQITTARQLWSVVPRSDYVLFDLIARCCFDHCKPLLPDGELELLLIGESGTIEAKVKG